MHSEHDSVDIVTPKADMERIEQMPGIGDTAECRKVCQSRLTWNDGRMRHVKVTAGACRNAMRMSDKGDRHCLCEKCQTSSFF
jgi:hypothetical protein